MHFQDQVLQKKQSQIRKFDVSTLIVTIFQNGRRNINVPISQFLIHVENIFFVSKHIFSGPRFTKKTIINTQI